MKCTHAIRGWPLWLAALTGIGAVLTCTVYAEPATTTDDALLRGYCLAVITREFGLDAEALQVADGVVCVDAPMLTAGQQAALRQALEQAPGLRELRLAGGLSASASDADTAAPASSPRGAGASAGPWPTLDDTAAADARSAMANVEGLLPAERLFDPLMADPRWPHFSAALHHYASDDELTTVGAVSFGETFSLYQQTLYDAARWGLVLPAGVFAIFDMDAESRDLVNADYRVGFGPAYRRPDGFSAIAMVYHQSSHLGDEFLLRSRIERINLSYEGLDIKLSQTFDPFGENREADATAHTGDRHRDDPWRIYVGGGYLVHTDPDGLAPWSSQAGAEWRGHPTLLRGRARPVAAVDLQFAEEHGWATDVSLRAGLEFANPQLPTRRIQLLIEYYNGHSPNGQFYERAIHYLGFGVHGHF